MEKRKREEEETTEAKKQKTTDNTELLRLIRGANEQQLRNVLKKVVEQTDSQSLAVELLKKEV
jgi:hypothetical protein